MTAAAEPVCGGEGDPDGRAPGPCEQGPPRHETQAWASMREAGQAAEQEAEAQLSPMLPPYAGDASSSFV